MSIFFTIILDKQCFFFIMTRTKKCWMCVGYYQFEKKSFVGFIVQLSFILDIWFYFAVCAAPFIMSYSQDAVLWKINCLFLSTFTGLCPHLKLACSEWYCYIFKYCFFKFCAVIETSVHFYKWISPFYWIWGL